MPIYEYVCQSCGHSHEVIQKVSADPLTTCPQCNEEALKKKVTAAAFRLNGSGWYETDFKAGDNKKNLTTSDKEPEKKDSSSDKKEPKSEAKTETVKKSASTETKSAQKPTAD